MFLTKDTGKSFLVWLFLFIIITYTQLYHDDIKFTFVYSSIVVSLYYRYSTSNILFILVKRVSFTLYIEELLTCRSHQISDNYKIIMRLFTKYSIHFRDIYIVSL